MTGGCHTRGSKDAGHAMAQQQVSLKKILKNVEIVFIMYSGTVIVRGWTDISKNLTISGTGMVDMLSSSMRCKTHNH